MASRKPPPPPEPHMVVVERVIHLAAILAALYQTQLAQAAQLM